MQNGLFLTVRNRPAVEYDPYLGSGVEAEAGVGSVSSSHPSKMAEFVVSRWMRAYLYKTQNVVPRLERCMRARKGEYDPDVLQRIHESGGTDIFSKITETKCSAAAAWLLDMFVQGGERTWGLDPTPIPTLPDEMREDILNRIISEQASRIAAGMNPITPVEAREMALEMEKQMLDMMRDRAKKIAERHEEYLADQLEEANFVVEFRHFIQDLVTFPLACMKGPVVERRMRHKWSGDRVVSVEEFIPVWRRVSPWDLYPDPNSRNISDSWVCETGRISGEELSNCMDMPGWSNAEILAVLDEGPAASRVPMEADSERATMENRDISQDEGYPEDTYTTIEFWGRVRADMLIEWGATWALNENSPYCDVQIIAIGKHVVKAIKNPMPVGLIPYFCCSYHPIPGSLWGTALPELMDDVQRATNAVVRAMLDNAAIASGPFVTIDVDAFDASEVRNLTELWPMRVYQYHSLRTPGNPQPVKFHQISGLFHELVAIAEFFERRADDRTLVPRYAHGNENMGGAGRTASGLAMLINQGGRAITRVVADVDMYVMRGLLNLAYLWNLVYSDNPLIKGDLRVAPRGTVAQISKEQTQARRQQFLLSTLNDVDMRIIGLRGRAKLLRSVAEGLGMNVNEIIPPDDEMQKMTLTAPASPSHLPEAVGGPSPIHAPPTASPPQTMQYGAPPEETVPISPEKLQ